MLISGFGFLVYLVLAIPLMGLMAAQGIALANSISYSSQAIGLIFLLNKHVPEAFGLRGPFLRSLLSALLAGLAAWFVLFVLPIQISPLFLSLIAMAVGALVGVVPTWKEIRLVFQL
jgi:peptidoglycan biosynthesis protein MviN/MurJ (putative lipid II flippase)